MYKVRITVLSLVLTVVAVSLTVPTARGWGPGAISCLKSGDITSMTAVAPCCNAPDKASGHVYYWVDCSTKGNQVCQTCLLVMHFRLDGQDWIFQHSSMEDKTGQCQLTPHDNDYAWQATFTHASSHKTLAYLYSEPCSQNGNLLDQDVVYWSL